MGFLFTLGLFAQVFSNLYDASRSLWLIRSFVLPSTISRSTFDTKDLGLSFHRGIMHYGVDEHAPTMIYQKRISPEGKHCDIWLLPEDTFLETVKSNKVIWQ